jgi:hypothetical protein
MRAYGALSPIKQIPQPPDTVQTMLIANSSGQAMDWGSTLAQLVRFTGISTALPAIPINFVVNLRTTQAGAPSSGSSISTNSSGSNILVIGSRTLQIPGGSTGWSAAAVSSGYVIAEQWRK